MMPRRWPQYPINRKTPAVRMRRGRRVTQPDLHSDHPHAPGPAHGRSPGHKHVHGHSHSHRCTDYHRAFASGIRLNVARLVAGVAAGLLVGSLALLADAGRNLGGVLGLALAW